MSTKVSYAICDMTAAAVMIRNRENVFQTSISEDRWEPQSFTEFAALFVQFALVVTGFALSRIKYLRIKVVIIPTKTDAMIMKGIE